jgi:hypothetical protein
MRHIYGIDMKVSCKKDEVLETLRKNRAEHADLVEDSRRGYLKKAQEVLDKKKGDILKGKVVALHFDIHLPSDHTAEYDTVIRMLEMHTEDTVTLTADEVRNLIENKWEWMETFVASNQVYSPLFEEKGMSIPT